ncbi:MAG: hypothetical protein FWG73_02945 [Planctomycetaceae bacterium]|nr:hypothetical protein [Planctomycetaceae bacterium]
MSTAVQTDLLAPFEIWEVRLDQSTIKFFEPLVVQPAILPPEEPGDNTYLIADVPELNISSHGLTRDELWECILGDIRFNWAAFVCENDGCLEPLAKSIKDSYLAVAEVVDG